MKQKHLIIALSLLISLSFMASATAHADTTTEAASTLTKRLEERKAAVKLKLQNAEQVRLQGRCKAAQVRTKVLDAQLSTSSNRQTTTLTTLKTRLTSLQTKLQTQSVDTTELAAALTTLDAKITTHNNEVKAYAQAIKDLGEMDCAADPTGFKATLESARTKQASLKTSFKDITSYVQQTIKPILVEIKTSLAT